MAKQRDTGYVWHTGLNDLAIYDFVQVVILVVPRQMKPRAFDEVKLQIPQK